MKSTYTKNEWLVRPDYCCAMSVNEPSELKMSHGECSFVRGINSKNKEHLCLVKIHL